ncbi:hypothetical protein Acr_11g0011880 [Actinidia rufa]|uniref:Uncharacterized protein n=1 Tax=Actinidia rufa TaxID=165716 RepID=A0A7J0FDV6_9ERIC|nr:hypothetical protein Acr_11g0011880 [Actinidia rufa]
MPLADPLAIVVPPVGKMPHWRGKKLWRAYLGGPGGTSSAFLTSPNEDAELWKPKFVVIRLDIQVTVANFAKDYDTSLALAWTVMLPKDVTDLEEEISDTIRDLLVMQQVQAQRPSYVAATQAQNEDVAARAERDMALKDLTKLQVVACGLVDSLPEVNFFPQVYGLQSSIKSRSSSIIPRGAMPR